MNGLLRSITTGVLTIAVAGAGVPSVLVAHAANTPPVITSVTLTPVVASEGDTVRLDVTFTDPDADMEAVTVLWGDGSNSAFTLMGNERSFFVTRTYPDDFPSGTPTDTHLVTVDIEDLVNPAVRGSATLTLNNVAPVVTGFTVSPGTIQRDQSATARITFDDPSRGDTYPLELDWGDLSPHTFTTVGTNVRDFSLSHLYLRGGTFTVTATITDDDAGAAGATRATATVVVTSPNTVPSALVVSAGPAVEGETTTLTARFVDPDTGDTHSASVDWGDETAVQSLSLPAGVTTFSPSHVYQNSGSYTATVTVADSAASAPPATVGVEVQARNRAPSGLVLRATSPVEGNPATLTGSFTDLDVSDAHTVSVNWGDESISTVPLGAGVTSLSATHTYSEPGTYHVTATVTDPAGLSTAAAVDLVVQKKNSGTTKCDLLIVLEQRLLQSHWADDPRARALLERLIEFLSARYGCDDDRDEDGDEDGRDDRSGEHRAATTHSKNTAVTNTAPKVTARGDRSHRSDR